MKKIVTDVLKIIITIIIIIIGIVIGFKIYKDITYINPEIDENAEGTYTGYQLILNASYSGSGISGQDLGSGTETKTYNISDDDIFYESFSGGLWSLNLNLEENTDSFSPNIILKINKIEDEDIYIEFNDEEYIAKFDEEISVPSKTYVMDGINYIYTIKIIKEK